MFVRFYYYAIWTRALCVTVLCSIHSSPSSSDYQRLGASKPDKYVDATEVLRDGKVHFKIRVGENKVRNLFARVD